MKLIAMFKNRQPYIRLLLVVIALVPALTIHADGSKDLYPEGKTGLRAFLRSSTDPTENWPFPNMGTHYVYAEAGETITLASSAQGSGSARICLFNPSGTRVVNNTSGGVISNRMAELAGPRRQGQTGGNRYTPIYYEVETTGVYRVEFYARGTSAPSTTVSANAGWSQTSNAGIAAWDVSVINTANTGFVSGRVYTTVLNLSVGTTNPHLNGFHGLVYVRTYDGYTYRVNNNGNNGMYFTFFVNNNGFVDPDTQEPTYKSLNFSTASLLAGRVHNPNNADAETHMTHKLFYTLPANDLPQSSLVAVTNDGGSTWSSGGTWLKRTPLVPTISDVLLRGADGVGSQMSHKGGYIQFNANVDGNFKLQVIDKDSSTPIRTITGHAFEGLNTVYWDGKNDVGNPLPPGVADLNVAVQLQGAEVHFPFLDMEYNKQGTIIQLLDKDDLTKVKSDTVYWDDSDITDPTIVGALSNPMNNSHLPPTNSTGISSTLNGHIWGDGATGASASLNSMGDLRSIDTWAFITGEKEDEDFSTAVKVADLKITGVSSDKESVRPGSTLTYTIKVKNGESGDGNSDVTSAPFSFILPPGFEDADFDPLTGVDYEFTGGTCGTESITITYDPTTRTYSSELDLPNGCEITYQFTVKVTNTADPTNTGVFATILRPNDVTDPNATNTSDAGNPMVPDPDNPFTYEGDLDDYYFPPRDPFFECEYNGGAECNNIMSKTITLVESNYWHGTVSNEWADANNWTGNWVPGAGEDVEFATEVNNPTVGGNDSSGPARRDLYLDSVDQPFTPEGTNSGGRIIGDMINDSERDLVITTGNQLIINGEVRDGNPDEGTIVVKSVSINPDPVTGVFPNEPTGTLIVNPVENPGGVEALVEFYNQAYDCEDCGFYTRGWQYFGIPVNSAGVPYDDVAGNETVNVWTEPYNGNKWRPVSTGTDLEAFKGYQITNDVDERPTGVYHFAGTLNTNASVPLTRTANVNYPGANLVGNSYTAAIPIAPNAITFPPGVDETVYLFNTGTRDQWRKLNGTVINQAGYRSGQYLAVPVSRGGTDHFPDRIPSMHAFMVVVPESNSGGNLAIDYSRLVKNSKVALGDGSTEIVTRSAGTDSRSNTGSKASATTTLSLVMDIIGEQSADRVWLFAREGTTHGFDNGWDARKITESGIVQLYVAGTDESQLQVATASSMDNAVLGFVADTDGSYTLEFSLSEQVYNAGLFLHDMVTGKSVKLSNSSSYTFEAKKGEAFNRFRLSQSNQFETIGNEALVSVEPVGDEKIVVVNGSGNTVTIFISTPGGGLLRQVEVPANGKTVLEGIPAGIQVVRLQNAAINDTRRVVVK